MSQSNHVQITFQHDNADQAWVFWKTVLLPNVFTSKDLPGSATRIVPVGWTAAYERVGHDHTHVYIGFTSRWTLQNIKWYLTECHDMANGGHIELCRGQPSENVHYLLGGPGVDGKETPREVIPHDFFQRDETPPSWAPNRYFYQVGHVLPDNVNVKRGQRTDLEDVYNDLEQGIDYITISDSESDDLNRDGMASFGKEVSETCHNVSPEPEYSLFYAPSKARPCKTDQSVLEWTSQGLAKKLFRDLGISDDEADCMVLGRERQHRQNLDVPVSRRSQRISVPRIGSPSRLGTCPVCGRRGLDCCRNMRRLNKEFRKLGRILGYDSPTESDYESAGSS